MMTLTGHWENLVLNMVEVLGKTFLKAFSSQSLVSPKEVNCSVAMSEKAVNVDYMQGISVPVFFIFV